MESISITLNICTSCRHITRIPHCISIFLSLFGILPVFFFFSWGWGGGGGSGGGGGGGGGGGVKHHTKKSMQVYTPKPAQENWCEQVF